MTSGLHIVVGIEVGDVRDEILVDAMLTVCTADSALLHACMEALNGLKVLSVDVGFAKLQFAACLNSHIQVFCEDA